MNRLLRDISLSAVIAGFIATVISYAGPLVIIFQAAEAGGLPREVVSSWVWTVSIGSGVLGVHLVGPGDLGFQLGAAAAMAFPLGIEFAHLIFQA